MIVRIDGAAVRRTKWHEYAIRFFFGGLVTVATGEIGKLWGPIVAGLFLAFPAIFPASVTLVEKKERERKRQKGLHGERRGQTAAADYALGAAIGSTGLVAFAIACRFLLPRLSTAVVLLCALVAWSVVAGLAWLVRKRFRR